MSTSVDKLAQEIYGIRNELRGLSGGPQLAFSSIEDGAIDEYDSEGTLTSQLGEQWDGTHAAVSLAGPIPPTPTTPQVTVGSRSLTVRWDGRFQGGAMSPMDLKQVEVVMATDAAETDAAIRATIVGELGAEVVVAPLPEKEHYVWLVARTFSGKSSHESISVQATPAEVVAPGTVITGAVIQTDYADNVGVKLDDGGLIAHPETNGAIASFGSNIKDGYAGVSFEGSTNTIGIYSTGDVLRFESDSISPSAGYMAVSTTGIIFEGGDIDIYSRVAIRDNLVVNAVEDGSEVFAAYSDATYPGGMVRSQPTYDNTTTVSSNLNVSSGGFLRRSTSLESAKINIDRKWADTAPLDAIKRLTPTSYYDKGNAERYSKLQELFARGLPVPHHVDADQPVRLLGLIAEDVAKLGLPELNTFDGEGNINGVAYERVGVALIPWEHEQDSRLAEAEKRIDSLEADVKALTARINGPRNTSAP